jgi:hypothetical protein
MFNHAQGIDAMCTSLSGHCARKMQYWFYGVTVQPEVIENRFCEGTDGLNATLNSGITSLQMMVACKRCELGEQ